MTTAISQNVIVRGKNHEKRIVTLNNGRVNVFYFVETPKGTMRNLPQHANRFICAEIETELANQK